EFCSKFAWSTRNCNSARRLRSQRRHKTSLRKERGTKHDHGQFSWKDKRGMDRNRRLAAGAGGFARAWAQGDSQPIRRFSAGSAGLPEKREGKERSGTKGARKGEQERRCGTEGRRSGAGKGRPAERIV